MYIVTDINSMFGIKSCLKLLSKEGCKVAKLCALTQFMSPVIQLSLAGS